MNAQALTQDKVESTRLAEVPYLGAIIATDERDTESLAAHLFAVSTDDLTFPEHRVIHRAMIHLHRESGEVEIGALIDHLRRSGRLEEAGGGEYLMELMDAIPTAASLESYTREVREVAQRRRQAEVLEKCASLARETSVSPTELRRVVAAGMEKVTPVVTASSPWSDAPRLPGPPEPDPLPLDALPDAMGAHVRAVAANLQVPEDLPLLLALGAVSAAVAGRVEVDVRSGWREPVGLYVAAILPPAGRKSPAFGEMTRPIRAWESESVRRAAGLVLAAEDVVEVADQRLARAKKEAAQGNGSSDAVEAARLELEAARAKVPPDGRLLAGDITPEAMVQRMAKQGGRLAILEPEPGPLQLVAGRYSDSPQLDELKKAWSAETLLVDRVGRAPLRVPRPALTLVLCLQPGVLQSLQNGPAFRLEGVLGRFLWCQPPHGLGQRLTGPAVPPINEEVRERVSGLLEILLKAEPAGVGVDGTPVPHVLTLDSEALDVLHAYEAEVEKDLVDSGRFAGIRDWAGKAVGQAVRVAALLELAARAEDRRSLFGGPLGAWAMGSAVRILRALSSHALYVLGEVGIDRRTVLLRYVFRRAVALIAAPPPEPEGGASLRNLWQACRGRAEIDSMAALTPLVTSLEELGCIRLVDQSSTGGRPPSPRIELHPTLRESIPKSPISAREDRSRGTFGSLGDVERGSQNETDREYREAERTEMQEDARSPEPLAMVLDDA